MNATLNLNSNFLAGIACTRTRLFSSTHSCSQCLLENLPPHGKPRLRQESPSQALKMTLKRYVCALSLAQEYKYIHIGPLGEVAPV